MEPLCYLNGALVPLSKASISPLDIGLLRGFGIYEALRTFHRIPFEFEAHLRRFHRSAEHMKLRIPETDEHIRAVIDELIARNVQQGKEAVIRFILTGGIAIGGIEYDRAKPTFYMLVEALQEVAEEVRTRGCSLLVHEHQRLFPEYKTTNYATAVLLQEERRRAGALEILYTYREEVLEPATSNLFIVKDGVIVTPKDDILAGITRGVVIDLARKEFAVEERNVSTDELYAADEAFLTSSFKNVVPVVSVGGKQIGSGKPGVVTMRVMALFDEFAAAYRG